MVQDDASRNLVLIISGPAGSGKTTLCDQLLEEFPDSVQRLVTTTSRLPRPGGKVLESHGAPFETLKGLLHGQSNRREATTHHWIRIDEMLEGIELPLREAGKLDGVVGATSRDPPAVR